MRLPRYREYMSTGLRWQREAPSHWAGSRIRFMATLNPSKSEVAALDRDTEVSFLPMDAIGDDGTLSLERTRPISEVESGYTYFRDGDVVVAKITPCFENGKGALMNGLVNGTGFGTTELIVARPRSGKLDGAFLSWLFRSPNFRSEGEGSMYGAGGQKRVPDDFVRDFSWAFPTFEEQVAIAAFLDRETAKIDALIAEQERLLELLAEKRQAVISHAVTKGPNPDAPMKDSGVAWLGEVPAHWDVARLATLYREVSEPGSDDRPTLSVSIHDGVSDDEIDEADSERKITRSEDKGKYKRVEPNDLTYNMMRAWQGAFGTVTVSGQVSPAYVVARPRAIIETGFIEALLRTPKAKEQIRRYSRGITDFRLRLYWDEFKELRVGLPPHNEQVEVLASIAQMNRQFDELQSAAESLIELLDERRSALIAAAVTGQIDVREAA